MIAEVSWVDALELVVFSRDNNSAELKEAGVSVDENAIMR